MHHPIKIDTNRGSGAIHRYNQTRTSGVYSAKNGGCMRFLIFLIAVVFVSSPLSGATQEKPNRVNLGYSSNSGSQAILRVTKDAGIFQKNGLDVSMVLIAGGSGIIQALVAGDLPVAIVSGELAILARLQGADTVMLGGLINIID